MDNNIFSLSSNKAILDLKHLEETAQIAAFYSMNSIRNLSEEIQRIQIEASAAKRKNDHNTYVRKLMDIKSRSADLEYHASNYNQASNSLYYLASCYDREEIIISLPENKDFKEVA